MVRTILAFLFLLFAASLFAQNSEFTPYVGGLIGSKVSLLTPSAVPNIDATFDDKITGGFRLAYFFNKHVGFEGGFGYSPLTVRTSVPYPIGQNQTANFVSINTYILQANVVAQLAGGPVIPYVTGGVGGIHFAVDRYFYGLPTPSETDFAWDAGGGIKIPVNQSVAFRFDGRVYGVSPQFSSGTTYLKEITGGVSFLFDF